MSSRAPGSGARGLTGLALPALAVVLSGGLGCAADSSAPQTVQQAMPNQASAMSGQAQPQQQLGTQSSGAAAGSGMTIAAAASGSAGDLGAARPAASASASVSAGSSGTASASMNPRMMAGSTAASAAGSGASAPAAGGSAMSAAAGSGGRVAGGNAGKSGSSTTGATTTAGQTPVYRIPLRLHVGMSKLTDAELIPILEEMNKIWLSQAGICFEVEVTESEDNRSDGFDFRYTSARIPSAPSANGVTENAHSIWSIDHPQLSKAPNPVMYPTARTTAHELGHALGLAHENPPPSSDCASPCYCAMRGDNCDDYLLRSGTTGFFLSPPEVEITRQHAAKVGLSDQAALQCGMASIQR